MSDNAYLRSINVALDIDAPERLAHFVPTRKGVHLIEALASLRPDRAFLVIAPYGTGKSLAAAVAVHAVENREISHPLLRRIHPQVPAEDQTASLFFADRLRNKGRGIALALSGHQPSVVESIRKAALAAFSRHTLGRQAKALHEASDDLNEMLSRIADVCERSGIDRVSLVWDEFGKHLEALAERGEASALLDVQHLAEFAARATVVPMGMALLLHQGFLHYTTGLSQGARTEWTKIEGRFRTLEFVDDSRELLGLVGKVMEERSSLHTKKTGLRRAAKTCKQLGMFTDIKSEKELVALLDAAFPLSPVTLHLLPRISARIAQNERTMFDFLFSVAGQDEIHPCAVFDFYSDLMRYDAGAGGTRRQWIEAQSALSKCESKEEEDAIKAACLLGLGLSGERSRTPLQQLRFAVSGITGPDAAAAIQGLIERKLLLHRVHVDEVQVWHGTDVDLRGRLNEQKEQLAPTFDLVSYLDRQAPPPVWFPDVHNIRFGLTRYFESEYCSSQRLRQRLSTGIFEEDLLEDADGRIVYVLPSTAEEREDVLRLVQSGRGQDRTIFVIAPTSRSLEDAALEVAAITHLRGDSSLIASDPLTVKELDQLEQDARGYLARCIDRLVDPSVRDSRWYFRGAELPLDSRLAVVGALSDICDELYPSTPEIRSEQIVRKKPTSVMINARKKLLLAILERSGQENLGIKGNFPDASMFRTVLLRTGLYQKDERSGWGYAAPHQKSILSAGVREVWSLVHDFFTTPSDRPKSVSTLVTRLVQPPFGVRHGLIPILFAAGLKAFPSALSILRDGQYIDDLMPSTIEEMFKAPDRFKIHVLEIDDRNHAFLSALHSVFSASGADDFSESDQIRRAHDAVQGWLTALPEACLQAQSLSDEARRFRAVLMRYTDPVAGLVRELPATLSLTGPLNRRNAEKVLWDVKSMIEEGVRSYFDDAHRILQATLPGGRERAGVSSMQLARHWAECFPDERVDALQQGVAKGLLSRMMTSYASDDVLLESLSTLLIGRPVSRWDDSCATAFERELASTVRQIEDFALGGNVNLLELSRDARARVAQIRVDRAADAIAELLGLGDEALLAEAIEKAQKYQEK
ncbi:MAG: hypothetical protein KDB90_04605 [Planctomycetes bacterium]|nr:hypothetical protein [Planctomycetota bacterium]